MSELELKTTFTEIMFQMLVSVATTVKLLQLSQAVTMKPADVHVNV